MIFFIRFRIQFFPHMIQIVSYDFIQISLKISQFVFYSPGYFLPGTFGGEKASAVPRRPASDAKIFISELFCSSQILQKLTHVQKSYRIWRLLPKMEEIEIFIVFKQAKPQPPALESQNLSRARNEGAREPKSLRNFRSYNTWSKVSHSDISK